MEIMFSNTTNITVEELEALSKFNNVEMSKIKKTHLVFYLAVVGVLFVLEALGIFLFKSYVTVIVPALLGAYFIFNFIKVQRKYQTMEKENAAIKECKAQKADFYDDGIKVEKEGEKGFSLFYKDVLEVWSAPKRYYVYTKESLLILGKSRFKRGKKDEFIPFLESKIGKNKYVDAESFDLD